MNEPSLRRLYPWFTVLSLLVGGLIVAAFYKDQFRDWKDWQRRYIKQEIARAATPEQRAQAARIPVEVHQYVLTESERVDRCTTCHAAVEDSSYAGLPQPLAYHPNHDRHPFEKFGCTICHQGQGSATTRQAAHGQVEHWDRPMIELRIHPVRLRQMSPAQRHPGRPPTGAGPGRLREQRLYRLP